MKETFAGRLRVAAQKVGEGGREFSVNDLVDAMGIQDRAGKRKIWESSRDFVRYGEWERVDKGLYRITGKERTVKTPEKRQVMWRYLRMKRQRGESVTIDDLVEMSGASEAWAREWIGQLVKNGVVRDHGNGKFKLIKDQVPMPVFDEKAEKLRQLRRSRIEALRQAAQHAHNALNSLMAAIEVDGLIDQEA